MVVGGAGGLRSRGVSVRVMLRLVAHRAGLIRSVNILKVGHPNLAATSFCVSRSNYWIAGEFGMGVCINESTRRGYFECLMIWAGLVCSNCLILYGSRARAFSLSSIHSLAVLLVYR